MTLFEMVVVKKVIQMVVVVVVVVKKVRSRSGAHWVLRKKPRRGWRATGHRLRETQRG